VGRDGLIGRVSDGLPPLRLGQLRDEQVLDLLAAEVAEGDSAERGQDVQVEPLAVQGDGRGLRRGGELAEPALRVVLQSGRGVNSGPLRLIALRASLGLEVQRRLLGVDRLPSAGAGAVVVVRYPLLPRRLTAISGLAS